MAKHGGLLRDKHIYGKSSQKALNPSCGPPDRPGKFTFNCLQLGEAYACH